MRKKRIGEGAAEIIQDTKLPTVVPVKGHEGGIFNLAVMNADDATALFLLCKHQCGQQKKSSLGKRNVE